MSAGLVTCLVTAVTVGCGTVHAGQPGSPGHATAAARVAGATQGSFAAVRPGQAFVTSVRPPCQTTISGGKNELEPNDQIPRSYPLRLCPPANRFSVTIVVVS